MKKLHILVLFFWVWLSADAQNIVQYEYWYDNNYSGATVVNNSSGSILDLTTLLTSTAVLTPGLHTVNIRAKDNVGKWSSVLSEYFYATSNMSIVSYEYWFDDDYANKIATAVAGSPSYILTSNLNTSAVGYGAHTLNFRAKDNVGKWSAVIKEYIFKSVSGAEMSKAEYWIDSNYADRQAVTFTSSNIVFINQNLLTSNVDDQLHTFNFRMQDQAGKWSVVTCSYFMGHSQIVSYEYWFDTNYANRKTVNITPTDLLTFEPDIDANGLSGGVHVVNFRAKNNFGKYSTTIAHNFTVYITPLFSFQTSSCEGTLFTLPTTSSNGIEGTWSPAVNNLVTTTYTFTPNVGQFASGTVDLTVAIGLTTTWNGTSWDNGAPSSTHKAIINGNYSEAVNLTACSLDVVGTSVVSIPSGFSLQISGAVTVASTASMTFQNNANLIQAGAVNNNVGNITVKRDTQMIRQDYTFWSSPVRGQNLLDFSPLTLTNRFYILDEVSNVFVWSNPATTIFDNTNIAKGFSIRAPNTFPDSSTTFTGNFTGVPNNGDISIPITNSGAGQGFNLIGNPYPSPINALTFLNSNPGTLYFWTHTAQGANLGTNYASFNTLGGTKASAIVGAVTTFSPVPNGLIQTAQGFIIEKSSSGNAVFNNAMRVNDSQNQFFKLKAVEKHRIWINLTSETASNQILLGYMEGATNKVDESIDGKQIETKTAISSTINNENYVIQGRALPFNDADIVPLSLKADSAGTYTLSIDNVDGLFAGNQAVYLKDKLIHSVQNLKEKAYTFNSEIGIFDNRFELVFSEATLGIENPNLSDNSIVAFKKDNSIQINSGSTTMDSVKLFDVNGRIIAKKNNINSSETVLNHLAIAQGVVLVHITTTENQIVTIKLVY